MRQKSPLILLSCVTAIFVLLLHTAVADQLRDPTTGLAIDPPQGYDARAISPTPTFVSRFEVKKPADHDTGCQVAFTPQSQNADLTQDEINAILQKSQWLDLARAALAMNYELSMIEPFQYGDMRGVAMVGDIKNRAGIPSRSQKVRTLFVILETPKGRTTTICVSEKENFVRRKSEFEAVARATTVPR